jgi:hypothetical protein
LKVQVNLFTFNAKGGAMGRNRLPSGGLGIFNIITRQTFSVFTHSTKSTAAGRKNWQFLRSRGAMGAIMPMIALLICATQLVTTHATDPPVVEESGTLSSNEEWTSDNVYEIVGQVTVPSGDTLTIDAGTVVKYETGGSWRPIQVDSGGTLDANGTSGNPIIFTSWNDNSVGGSTGSGSPAADDYNLAISPNGGTIDVSYATFEYAYQAVEDAGSDGSSVTITDSTFNDEYAGVNMGSATHTSLILERNSFDLSTSSSSNYAIEVSHANSLADIVLSGVNSNTFTGSGNNVTVEAEGSSYVASGTTWEIDSSSGAILKGYGGSGIKVEGTLSLDSDTVLLCNSNPTIQVDGTMNLADGVAVKGTSSSAPIQVNSGGTLNGTGSSGNPIIFTSINDNSVGGSTGSGSPAASDYGNAIVLNGGTVDVSYATLEYAYQAVADSGGDDGSSVTITDSTFSNEYSGVNLNGSTNTTLVLQRNSFDLGTSTSSAYAVEVSHDNNLANIVLAGSDENTFTGSGNNVTVTAEGSSDVASGTTWTVDSGSGAVLNGHGYQAFSVDGTLDLNDNTELMGDDFPTVQVNGTMGLGNGVVVKGNGSNAMPIQVNSGGTLNGTGSSGNPIIFTSINDNSVGGSTGSGSPAASDYNDAIGLNGGTVDITYATYEYASTAIDDLNGSDSSTITISNSSFSNNDTGSDILLNDQANFANVTMSNETNGLEVSDTAQVVYRGSFSGISNKAIQSCNWGSNSGNGCYVDAAYVDWGSSDGPFAANPSYDMACGSTTVAPWVYDGTDYNNTNLFQVPNCDGSSTPDSDLADAANSFGSSLAAYYTSCNGGLQSACTAYNDEISCLEDAINLASSATGNPITLPNDDSHQWAVDASTTASDIVSGAASAAQAVESNSVTDFEVPFFNNLINIVTFVNDATNAYNQCVQ